MSTTNRQRRAQKQQRRNRQRSAPERSWEQRRDDDDRFGPSGVAGFLELVAAEYATTGRLAAQWLAEIQGIRDVDEVFDQLRERHWTLVCERGWDEELVRRGLRKLSPVMVRGLFEGEKLSVIDDLTLLSWLMRLPKLPVVTRRAEVGDTKMLDRVRALLAKAESTTFPEEAEAFTMKAQQLITEHCLQDALSSHASADEPRLTRIVADDPYADAKSLLISVVASANRCRAVWFDSFGFATVVGYQADLDAVELIFTSLLVQATRSMAAVGQEHPNKRSPSFRRSFIVAFASRIGERLKVAQGSAMEPIADDRLLPVLAARDSRVEDVTGEMFPDLTSSTVSVTNGHGWAAGRSAADHAELSPLDRVGGS